MSETLWTPSLVAQLRALWAQGLSASEIARRLTTLAILAPGASEDAAITKNAVVGKAHRLSLPPRPSPLKRQRAAV